MSDLENPKLIYAKGVLFLVTGSLAASLIVVDEPSLRIVFLLGVTVWCFSRAYYFAFYVVERYITGRATSDGRIRLSGLLQGLRIAYARHRDASLEPPGNDRL